MREAKAPARQWFDEAIGNQRIKAAVALEVVGPTGAQCRRGNWVVACPKYCHEFAANLSISSLELLGAFCPRHLGWPTGGKPRAVAPMGHRSQEGDDAWQTSAPSSMIATDHTAALGPSEGSSSCATARSSFVALEVAGCSSPKMTRASTRLTLVSRTTTRSSNAKAATAAAVVPDTGKREQLVVCARNLTAEVVANDRSSIT